MPLPALPNLAASGLSGVTILRGKYGKFSPLKVRQAAIQRSKVAKFILHIGDAKCGSTAIQNSLYRSRKTLAEKGIYFDTLFPNSGHVALTLLFGQRSRGASKKREALAAQTLALLQEEARNYDWIILSAENFINLSPETVAQIADTIAGPVERLEAMAYVRDPVAMYASSIQQILKGSHLFPLPESYHRRVDHKLNAWQAHLGRERFQVRLFERRSLDGGDVVTDFAAYLASVTGTPITLSPASNNASLTAEQTCILQRFRMAVYPDQPGTLQPRSTVLAQFLASLNTIRSSGTPIALSDLARDVVSHRNADVVDELVRSFPDLDLAAVSERSAHPPQGPYPWTDNPSVETILASINEGVVDCFASLLPELNGGTAIGEQGLDAAMSGLGFQTPQEIVAFREAWESYLKASASCAR